MKLFYSPTSPYVRKVVVCAEEAGLQAAIERVPATVTPVTDSPDVAAANPLAKVPTLVLDDGTALFDSRVIVEYLDHRSGGRLLPPAGPDRWRVLRDQATADGMTDAALMARYERALRPEALRWPEWDEGQIGKVRRALDELERGFQPSPGPPNAGDIAVACALGYLDFRFPELAWRDGRPRLTAFDTAMAARPSMQASAPPPG
jgi:glutathione S-transferase